MKRILLTLDASETGLAARHVAMNLAKEKGAHLTGVAILDTPWITAAQPEPLGGAAFKIHRDEAVISQSQSRIETLMRDFQAAALEKGVSHDSIEVEGFPATEIMRLAHSYDLVVMGQTTDFHFELDDDSDITTKHVARECARPVLLVPTKPVAADSRKVLVAYDGSSPASRALHLFLLLGFGKGREIEVLTINPDRKEAEEISTNAVKMCQSYGIKCSPHIVIADDNYAHTILQFAQQHADAMIVMGAFSHNILREALFGSCTKSMLKEATVPLFINH
ncbi:MAG: universal stress protein [Holosporales bacterium]